MEADTLQRLDANTVKLSGWVCVSVAVEATRMVMGVCVRLCVCVCVGVS